LGIVKKKFEINKLEMVKIIRYNGSFEG